MASNHRQHRPHRLSLPPRTATPTTAPITPSRHYPPFTPTPTPSKHRLPPPSSATTKSTRFSTSSLFLLLFSLRSLYSLLPFLQSSPSSFAVFPFSFLVSLLSFLLSLSFSLFFSKRSPNPNPNPNPSSKSKSIFAFHHSITRLQQRILFAKSILLAIVFLLRFQALRYCGTAAMIMAETSGHVASNFVFASGRNRSLIHLDRVNSNKVRGFFSLFIGIFLLSISWDRIECFPFSFVNLEKLGLSNVLIPNSEKCVRVWPMLLPFLSGFLGGYEQLTVNWGSIRDLGRKEVRLISLFYTTILLFIPAAISMLVFEAEGDSVSIGGLGWPLANTVVFGVLLSESYTDEKKPVASKDFRREFMVTFVCTVVLELLYYPELSLWGLLICGMLLGIGVMELDPVRSSSLELGMETPDSFLVSVTKVVRHIVSERKSRKIALFLLINTGYMVVEFVAGFMNNSLGLISDACHMLFDCAALGIGLYASYIARLPANGRYNYGRGRFEVLSGYTNAVFLVLVGALIVLESLERILEPQEISTSSLLTVSIGGLAVNVVGLIFFHDEHHHAHGGGVACSHSHSRSHSHVNVGDGHEIGGKHQEDHHYSHVHGGGDHEIGGKHQEDHRHSHVYGGGDHEIGGKHQEDHRHSHVHGGGGHEIGNKHQDHEHKSDRHRSHASEGNVSSTSHCHDHDHDHHDHDHHHHQDHHGHHHDHVLTSSTRVPGEDNQKHYDHDHDHGHHHDHHGHGHHHDGHDHEHHHGHDRDDHGHHHDHHDKDKQNHHHHHHHIDHNMEGIFLHVLADTLGSVGVVVSTLLIQYKGWLIADPACSIFISLLIVSSVIPLLRNSAEVLLQRVPRAHEHDLKAAVTSIMKIKGISGIHNFHVWSLANNDTVGTLHLYVSSETDKISAKKRVSEILRDAGVKDLTLQVEICR